MTIDQVRQLVAERGVHARKLREVVSLLSEDWHPLAELVRIPAVPRRTVQDLLKALGDDAESSGDRYRIAPGLVASYRSAFGVSGVRDHTDVLRQILVDIADVPPPLSSLDHVQATAETALNRAVWLDSAYDLTGRRLLCLGDHDLTSLAVAAVNPHVSITVVDLDERLLEFIDSRAAARGLDIRTLHCDMRFGLPASLLESFDLVFSDPPYSPEGMGLFAGRGIEALEDIAAGRLLLAYGYSDRTPALGLKVQQELQKLGLVFEAILPAFHRFDGAQAIGSAADLYVCRPTGRRAVSGGTRIYTHGAQSVESSGPSQEALSALSDLAPRPESSPPPKPRPAGWAEPVGKGAASLAVDLSADPGPWLLRTLLASSPARLACLVPNNHPAVSSEAGQKELQELVATRFRLKFLRNNPDAKTTIVVADQVLTGTLSLGERAVREVLMKAHGKLRNSWREALITASQGVLTKKQAAEIIDNAPVAQDDLELRLIDLPKHRIAALLPEISASAGYVERPES
ncbi:bis-aminopropyl spermidine synthase family protein [Lentzea flaviverrucosa]|uniref:Predicted methyltransferase n=1 Tax=Lentzea flaviverrucosa TaxID=200379 RepID=A0A1H9U595_9PSEU|nr:bis-aminopropyl spermidine synthase family protein [Lentzea flaviverrucosa]RDI33294.1 putative methyltransferase [Lentzea flaviverrucosa]SES04616.1 Predicted methyltransferase [Lentzea flaviverrucosa]